MAKPKTKKSEGLKKIQNHAPVKMKNPALKEFHKFPGLPIELRCIIWGLIIPDPRIICIVYDFIASEDTDKTFSKVKNPKIPILFHINKESRALAEKKYTLCLEPQPRRPIFIDMKRDTLLITSCMAMVGLAGRRFWLPYTTKRASSRDG